MSEHQFDVADTDAFQRWVREISTDGVNAVHVVDDDEVLAVLSKPQSPASTTPAGWIVAGHVHTDDQLPAPFDSIGAQSNNLGASLWVQLTTGAMIAAIPTGTWYMTGSQYKFYYAAPNACSPVLLVGWNEAQGLWDGQDADAPHARHRQAIEYFNSVVGGTNTTYAATSGPGVQ